MKKVFLIAALAFFIFSCNNVNKKNQPVSTEIDRQEVAVMSIDELMDNADNLVDDVVTVKGTVMHVCKHSGARCFLMGSNEDVNIKIEAGDKIGAFENEQMGKLLTVRGTLRSDNVEIEDEHEHGEGDKEHATLHEPKEGHKVIYYIEGIELINTEE